MAKKKTKISAGEKHIDKAPQLHKEQEKSVPLDFNKVLQAAKTRLNSIKPSKKVVQVLLLVVAFIAPLGVAGVFGFAKYQEYQGRQATKEQEYQDKLQASLIEITALKEKSEQFKQETQQQTQELNQKLEAQSEQQKRVQQETQQKIAEAQQEADRKAEQVRLDAQQEAEKQRQLADKKISELELKVSEKGYEVSDIVKIWNPIMARIRCGPSSGSGTIKMDSLKIAVTVITNRHVIADEYGYAFSDRCEVTVPNIYQIYHFYTEDARISTSRDFAEATIIDSDTALRNTSLNHLNKPNCSTRPNIGDGIVILGYPGIGSQYTVTATEGIISGYDNNYFITSAKVEHGNSGGAAILTKKSCLLGIPTAAAVGSVESLARILDINSVLP